MNYHVSVHHLVMQLGLVVRAPSFEYQEPWVLVPCWLLARFVLISSGFLIFLALHVKGQLVCLWPVGILFIYYYYICFFLYLWTKMLIKGLPVWVTCMIVFVKFWSIFRLRAVPLQSVESKLGSTGGSERASHFIFCSLHSISLLAWPSWGTTCSLINFVQCFFTPVSTSLIYYS